MAQAALGGLDDAAVPTRYVFDEGHHLLDAADAAFSVRLSGHEGRELRRWLLGAEAGRSRARGLRRRIGDLVEADEDAAAALVEALVAARILPGDGWHQRLVEGRPLPGFEAFLALARRQVLARAATGDAAYRMEAEARPPVEGLTDSALRLAAGLERLSAALRRLSECLRRQLEDAENPPEPAMRQRLDAIVRGLERRAGVQLGSWSALLRDLGEPPQPETVEWLAIERSEGSETDVAVNRNWIDPGIPFAVSVAKPAHGLIVTSATLSDGEVEPGLAWQAAEAATGLRHLQESPASARIPSPFDYAAQTRVFIITDIPRDDIGQVAAAFAALMRSAQGGALGLFTAIARLRAVHERIAPVLEADGLLLLAQHVDGMSTATLVDIFRAEEDSCLLGTDAVRDGVDVPGRSLRLIVFDRVPWPRPDILHRARKPVFGGARVRRSHHAAAVAAGLWQAGAAGRRPRRLRDARPRLAVAPAAGVSAECPGAARYSLVEAVEDTSRFLGASR